MGIVPSPRFLKNGRIGDVGIVSYIYREPALQKTEFLAFVEGPLKYRLCPQNLRAILNPYPGPRSIVLFDNMPTHRATQLRVEAAIESRGLERESNPRCHLPLESTTVAGPQSNREVLGPVDQKLPQSHDTPPHY